MVISGYLNNIRRSFISQPPRTMMELYKGLPEGTLADLIEGQIYMSPPPTSRHQRILNRINVTIYNHFENTGKGEVFIGPLDVYLDDTANAVQPDIVVVLAENKYIVDGDGHIHGSPDLIIEILSIGNKEFDQIKKRNLHETFSVKEYWTVDPERKSCTGYTLNDGRYIPLGDFSAVIESPLLNLRIGI